MLPTVVQIWTRYIALILTVAATPAAFGAGGLESKSGDLRPNSKKNPDVARGETVEELTNQISRTGLPSKEKRRLLLRRAELFIDAGDCRSAIHDLDEVLVKDAKTAKALALRGYCHGKIGDAAAALGDYDTAILMAPRDVALRVARGAIYREEKRFNDLVEDLSAAIRVLGGNQSSDLFLQRGDAYSEMQEYEAAIRDYLKALRIAKSNVAKLLPKGVVGQGESFRPIYRRLSTAYAALADK